MNSTNRLLPLLVFVTLFVMGEVWGSSSNAWGSKSHTSGGTSSVSGHSGGPRSSSGSSPGRTQASDQNLRRTATRSPLPSREASTLHPSPGHHPKHHFPTLRPIQTTTASPSTRSTAVPNHPEKTTHSGIQISSASVEKCVDYKSPAESCFDYFTLAMLWPPGYAYKQSLKGHRARKELPQGWVIHGLWPSMYSKDATIPPSCSRRTARVNYDALHGNELRRKLSSSWVSVLESGYDTNDKFWRHEFQKHGDCATRSTAIMDLYGYFSKTYKLFDDLKIATKLDLYPPGTTEKLRTIIKMIENQVHKKVKVDYATKKTQNNQNINYLAEVFVCYDLKLKMIDCPNSSPPDSELEKEVLHLNQMPSTPPTTTLQPPVQKDDRIKNGGGATSRPRGRARRTASNSYSLGINFNSSALTN